MPKKLDLATALAICLYSKRHSPNTQEEMEVLRDAWDVIEDTAKTRIRQSSAK